MHWWKRLPARSKLLICCSVLAAACLIVFARSLGNEFVIWDDDSLIYKNPLMQRFSLFSIWGAFTSYDPELYVPVTMLSFQVEHLVAGFAPMLYHIDNLLLHIANACLVMVLLRRLGLRDGIAFIGAMLFALHPINVETVAWASARKDLLSGLFSLLALLSWLRHRSENNGRFPWMACLWTLLAMLSKPVAIVLPIAFLLLDWLKKKHFKKKDIVEFGPFIALSIFFLFIGLLGKEQNIAALSMWKTLLLGAKSAAFTLKTLFWPTALSPIYLQLTPIGLSQPDIAVSIIVLVALGVAALLLLKRTRVPLFGLLFFALFLAPSFANFAKDHSIYFSSDRYGYIAQLGILFIVLAGAEWITRERERLMLIAIPIFAFFGWTSFVQSRIWHDSETLYRDAITKNDQSAVMHYNLGMLAQQRGDDATALVEYEKTLTIDPHHAKAIVNIGMHYQQAGDRKKAMEEFQRAIHVDPNTPEAYNNIGSLLMDSGDVDGAIEQFRKAISIKYAFAQAHINLAAALGRKELFQEGLEEYRIAFTVDPRLGEQMPEIEKQLKNFRP